MNGMTGVEKPVRRGKDVVRCESVGRESAAVRAVDASRIRWGVSPAGSTTSTPDVALRSTGRARAVSSRTAEQEGESRSHAR